MVAVAVPATAASRVGHVTLNELVDSSAAIAVVRVEAVEQVDDDLRIARATVVRVLKGFPPSSIWFRASPSWTCDTSGAEVGEKALVFLKPVSDAVPESARIVLKGAALFEVAHSGRGHMPIRKLGGEEYADFFAGDVAIPEHVTTRQTPLVDYPPESETTDRLFRSARLADLVAEVGRIVGSPGAAR